MGNVFRGTPTRGTTSYGSIPSSRECPTCRGTGVIQDDADASTGGGGEYIALIPLTDQRLRPKHVTLKIILTVVLCLTITGLLLFFLLLRTVQLRSSCALLLPTAVQITNGTVSLNLSYPFNVTNWNYVPLYLESVDLMALYHANLLSETTVTLNQWVPARGTKELHVNQTLNFDEPIFSSYLPLMCRTNSTYYNQIYISFRTNVKVSTLGQHFELVLDTLQLVSCHPLDIQH
ncbi:hypothetical protein Aperf_G00000015802 [Anoplocephala perfoliata]